MHNNLVENSIRPTALGKKNWLFFSAMLMPANVALSSTIIESCRCRGIDPPSLPVRRAHQAPLDDQLAGQAHHSKKPGRELPDPLRRQPLHSSIITVIARGYDIYAANIKSMSIGRLACRLHLNGTARRKF